MEKKMISTVSVVVDVNPEYVLDEMAVSDVLDYIPDEEIVSHFQISYEDEELFELFDMRIEINSYKSIIQELPNLDQDELGMLLVQVIGRIK